METIGALPGVWHSPEVVFPCLGCQPVSLLGEGGGGGDEMNFQCI